MSQIKIKANLRGAKTKSYLHHMRLQGRVPAVIYGKGQPPQAVEVDLRELESAVRKKGRNALMDLVVQEERSQNKLVVMIKDLQRDDLRGDIIHADLFEISMTDKIHTRVPVILKGEAAVQKNGGIVQMGLREIEVEGLPGKLPETINLDISGLRIGEHLSVSDLPALEGCKVLTEPESVLVKISAPRRAEEDEKPASEDQKAEGRAAEDSKEGQAAPGSPDDGE